MSDLKPFMVMLAALLTASCGSDEPERTKIDAQVTETRMDDIDKIEGTINDDMIDTDTSTVDAPLAKDDGNLPTANETSDEADDDTAQ